jgi:hypothetical protein
MIQMMSVKYAFSLSLVFCLDSASDASVFTGPGAEPAGPADHNILSFDAVDDQQQKSGWMSTDHNTSCLKLLCFSSLIFDKTYFSSLMFDIVLVCRRPRQLQPMRVQIIIPNLAPVNSCLEASHASAFCSCLLWRPSAASAAAAGAAPGAAGAAAAPSASFAAAAEGGLGGA